VWKYFEEQANIRKSKCLVLDAKGRIKCGHLATGKNASTPVSTSFRSVQGPYVPQNQSTKASDTDLVAMEHMWIAEIGHTVTFNL